MNLKEQVTPYLQKLFEYFIQINKITDTWKMTWLSLLLKEGKDEAFPRSYHPFSLLNVDYKVLTSVTASPLFAAAALQAAGSDDYQKDWSGIG